MQLTKSNGRSAKSAAALLLESRIGERFDAIVTGASPKGTWVRLSIVPVEGKVVHGFEGIDVGDRIRVQLISTDVERGYIDSGKSTHQNEEKNMFDNILVPIDRSSLAECVLPHVVAIAGTFESRVMLLHVMDSTGQANRPRAVDRWIGRFGRPKPKPICTTWRSGCKQPACRLRDTFWKVRLPTKSSTSLVLTTPTSSILSSHGQSGLSGLDVSSVVQKIVLRASTSIMVIRAYHPGYT